MYSEFIEKLEEWVNTDTRNKSVSIKINRNGTEMFAYDFKKRTGIFININTDLDNLDKLIDDKAEKELKEQYEKLRNRFEYNKEGI